MMLMATRRKPPDMEKVENRCRTATWQQLILMRSGVQIAPAGLAIRKVNLSRSIIARAMLWPTPLAEMSRFTAKF
jgi:hypothetical protein